MQHFIGTYGYFAIFILMVAESADPPSAALGAAPYAGMDDHTDADRAAARAAASDGPGYRKAG